MSDPVVICSFARTPMGGFQGVFTGVKATELGATAVKAAVERAGVEAARVEQIMMGCVLPRPRSSMRNSKKAQPSGAIAGVGVVRMS